MAPNTHFSSDLSDPHHAWRQPSACLDLPTPSHPMDLEARDRADRARELLALESSHRIKNILSVVSGIVQLASRNRPELRAFVRSIRARIDALATAHDYILGRGGAAAATNGVQTVHGLIRLMTGPINLGDKEALSIEGADFAVGPQMAFNLALLVHELATNAVKYGALSAESGRIVIACAQRDSLYAISWREEGGPPLDGEPVASGFGTVLFERIAALAEIGIKRTWSPEGLRVAISIPMIMVMESSSQA